MISSLSQLSEQVDYWGDPYARLAERLLALAYRPDCYRPKIYSAPEISNQTIPPLGYVRAPIVITPGAFLLGLLVADVGFVFQLTDVALGHSFFSQPTPASFVAKQQLPQNILPFSVGNSALPWLFEAPYPVVGSGLFMAEFWNAVGELHDPFGPPPQNPVQAYINLMVAEPRCNANA
jgi:hypothetical protein